MNLIIWLFLLEISIVQSIEGLQTNRMALSLFKKLSSQNGKLTGQFNYHILSYNVHGVLRYLESYFKADLTIKVTHNYSNNKAIQ